MVPLVPDTLILFTFVHAVLEMHFVPGRRYGFINAIFWSFFEDPCCKSLSVMYVKENDEFSETRR